MAKLLIDANTCTGCEACIPTCPFGALSLKDGIAVVDEKCTFCGACVDVCPVSAITLEKEEKAVTIDLSAYKDVWVFVEHEHGKVSNVSFELLGEVAEAYAIEGSMDLINWSAFLTLTNATGRTTFSDPSGPSFGWRFYRAALLP